MDNQEYFELIRENIKASRDEHKDEYGHHPCAPHEKHQHDECPELCQCRHSCWDHVALNGHNLHYNGPKPTAYICVEPGCLCRMFVGQNPETEWHPTTKVPDHG